MKFRFSLEAVLKHRHRLEELAQKEFAQAQHDLDVVLKGIEAMYERMDQVRGDIRQSQDAGAARSLDEVRQMELFIEGQKIRIHSERLRARELMAVLEEKQEKLVEAMQERKVLEKLKEKKLAEFRERLRTMELKELDDMTMTRWDRRAFGGME